MLLQGCHPFKIKRCLPRVKSSLPESSLATRCVNTDCTLQVAGGQLLAQCINLSNSKTQAVHTCFQFNMNGKLLQSFAVQVIIKSIQQIKRPDIGFQVKLYQCIKSGMLWVHDHNGQLIPPCAVLRPRLHRLRQGNRTC